MARPRKNRTGETYTNNDGEKFTIIIYNSSKDLSVQFEDGTIVNNKQISDVNYGGLRNPNFYMKPKHYGIGFLGIGKYNFKSGINNTPEGNTWFNILSRCYDPKENQISYAGCTLHEDWHNFQNFAEWYHKNYVKDFALDKDLLVENNKIYGPNTCCYLPREINAAISVPQKTQYKPGVSINNGQFRSCIYLNEKLTHLGYFETEDEAYNEYKKFKLNHIIILAMKYKDKITTEAFNKLINFEVKHNF